jgi:hypothetical protein
MSGSVAFNLFLLAIPLYFVWSAFSYPLQARYIPLILGGIVVLFQILVLLGEWFPRLFRVFDSSLMSVEGQRNVRLELAETQGEVRQGWRAVAMSLWMAAFFLLWYLLGSLPATFGFIFLFLLISGKSRWWMALAVAAGMVVMIWALFVAMMKFQLFEGVLFGGLVPPF